MFCPAPQTTWRGELADQPDCLSSVALLGLERLVVAEIVVVTRAPA
jgi:hypothetical protein